MAGEPSDQTKGVVPDRPVGDMLSPEEAAKYTGFKIATIRRRLKDGTIPKYQPGGKGTRVAIPRSALSVDALVRKPTDSAVTAPIESTASPNSQNRRSGPAPRWLRDDTEYKDPRCPNDENTSQSSANSSVGG